MEGSLSTLRAAEWELGAALPDPVFLLDERWRVLFMSDDGAALLRRPVDEIVGRTIWDAYPDLSETLVERELTRAMEQQVAVSFVNHYEPLGIYFAVRARPFRGGLIVSFHDISQLKRAERAAETLAAERGVLARIAGLVARNVPPRELFDEVAREAADLEGVEGGAVFRFAGRTGVEIMGAASRFPSGEIFPAGSVIEDTGVFEELRASARPVFGRAEEIGSGPTRQVLRTNGRAAWLQVPIVVDGRLWGGLGLSTSRPGALDSESVQRQRELAELLSVAIANTEARSRLARAATTDPITGLANHRLFHARLRDAAAAASREGRPLALALFDLDRFGDVNDLHGHLYGDAVLKELARRLRAIAAPDQLLARIGGDEFAMIVPDCDAVGARLLVERIRGAVASRPFGEHRSDLTISAGVADLAAAGHGELLFACADGALYWSKLNGRDLVCTFEPSIVSELSPTDRAETLLRRKTLAGITALARAIDAKDPSTQRHSERVAQLVEQLARASGWPEPRIRLLTEAALVHDVGKIGIPDAILLQTGRLTEEQYEVVKRHAALGAEIVADVLLPEQVAWIRSHHERPDGRGYPDGLEHHEIDPGAALLSVADALDVMTVGRPYSRPMPLDAAVAECERLVGRQFTPEAAIALRTLHRAGALEDWDIAPG